MRTTIKYFTSVLTILLSALTTSCIEPPLNLPAQEVKVEMSIDMEVMANVWNLDMDWKSLWYYDWDERDRELWGDIAYPTPSSYEVRRYFLGNVPGAPHSNVDPFTIYDTSFRRTYEFGYYDILIWSNIDSKDGSQVVTVDDSSLDDVTASTTVTRGMTRIASIATVTTTTNILTGVNADSVHVVTGLYNQPEVFYSTYPRDIYISQLAEDYDYYDEKEKCWVKKISCELNPLVYIYVVQVIIRNNDGRIVGCTGDNAISSFSSGTSVNTGRTWDSPVLVYYGSRFKKHVDYEGEDVDIIGGKFTTYGLCDMPSYNDTKPNRLYQGSRPDLRNYLYVDLSFINGTKATLQADVTEQCQLQAHGGIITVVIDAKDIEVPPSPDPGTGSLFVPTVEDYDEVVYEIQL